MSSYFALLSPLAFWRYLAPIELLFVSEGCGGGFGSIPSTFLTLGDAVGSRCGPQTKNGGTSPYLLWPLASVFDRSSPLLNYDDDTMCWAVLAQKQYQKHFVHNEP